MPPNNREPAVCTYVKPRRSAGALDRAWRERTGQKAAHKTSRSLVAFLDRARRAVKHDDPGFAGLPRRFQSVLADLRRRPAALRT
ncbi:hypothetical protein BD414DRAFT_168810 [Trametes punicea]|nr:hypothetical protein BD414DRAFT_168810 [Trametes punicea]